MATKFKTKSAITRTASIKDISETFVSKQGVFGDGLSNDVSQILLRTTLVAMATKMRQNSL